MKNFLTKKATMIGSIVAAAVVLVLLIAFCARPVAVGYSYTYKADEGKMKLHFNSYSTVTVSIYDKDGKQEGEDSKVYYYERDGYVFILGSAEGEDKMTKDELKDAKKEIKELKDDEFEDYAKLSGIKINAFNLEYHGEEFKNAGAVATVVVLAVVDAALAGLAVASVVLSRKK